MLHFGGLHVSVITAGELLTWGLRAKAPAKRLPGVRDLLSACTLHTIDRAVADKFGEIRAQLLDQGLVIGEMDLFNAAVANLQNLTVVTHNRDRRWERPGF
jgi:predicted nucleic acid-binding protein